MNDECSFQEPLARLIKGRAKYLDIYPYTIENGLLLDPSGFWTGGGKYAVGDMLPVRRCMFMGVETRCPNEPRAILYDLYGKTATGLSPSWICRNKKWVKAKYG